MDRWRGKVVVVTGASAGIGEAIAKRLVEAGMKVVGFARRVEIVQDLSVKLAKHSGKLYAVKCDISKEEEVIKAFDWVKNNIGPVHILVNNAGVARQTTLMDGVTEEWKKIIDTNLLGLCICTREAIKQMKEHNFAGHIIHINSILGHYVAYIPHSNVYAATKHAVTALNETLRQELNMEGSNIRISSISPGIVSTEIASGYKFDQQEVEDYKKVPKLKPEDVAEAVEFVIQVPSHVLVQDIIIRPVGEKL